LKILYGLGENHFIQQLKQKDERAFSELVKQFSDKVYNTAMDILQNEEDARDISQEVFVEIFQSIQSFKGESKLSTWIYRITVTKSLEHIRKKNRSKRLAIVQSLFGKENSLPVQDQSHFYHPGVRLENKERTAILFKAIDRLPENQKTAFILHKLEHLSYVEISDVMQVSLSSVESLLVRAKQNLRRLLSKYYTENQG